MTDTSKQVTRVGAYAIIRDPNDHFLLCRISPQIPRLAGQWTLPGGGIEFSEDPVDAMIREVKEETGLIATNPSLAGVDAKHSQIDDVDFHHIRILYFADVAAGTLTYEQEGSTDMCAWQDRHKLATLKLADLTHFGISLLKGNHNL